MGVNNLIEIFDDKYYDELRGGILEAFGKLFAPLQKNIKRHIISPLPRWIQNA